VSKGAEPPTLSLAIGVLTEPDQPFWNLKLRIAIRAAASGLRGVEESLRDERWMVGVASQSEEAGGLFAGGGLAGKRGS
jgi:hypothetical protein